jgi:hypothetical protein
LLVSRFIRLWIPLLAVGVILGPVAMLPAQIPASAAVDTSYVPEDLRDSIRHLKRLLPSSTIAWVRDSAHAEFDMAVLHHGLGTWIRNTWGLWGDSRLAAYFNGIGIEHPDDMSSIVLNSLWRELHGLPVDLRSQVDYYQQYWRVNTPPDSLAHEACATGVQLQGGIASPPDSVPRFVHLGTCQSDGGWWAYESDRGWYRPDSATVAGFRGSVDRPSPNKR